MYFCCDSGALPCNSVFVADLCFEALTVINQKIYSHTVHVERGYTTDFDSRWRWTAKARTHDIVCWSTRRVCDTTTKAGKFWESYQRNSVFQYCSVMKEKCNNWKSALRENLSRLTAYECQKEIESYTKLCVDSRTCAQPHQFLKYKK